MKTSESNKSVLQALFKARTCFAKAARDKQNSHLKNRYATLDSMLEAVVPALDDNDLMIMQSMLETSTSDTLNVETTLYHVSGEWVSFFMIMPIVKKDPQGVGSAFTYARRYSLAAALGISQSDDDAQMAVKSVKDWKKEVEKAETRDELVEVYKACKSQADAATWGIVEKAIIEKQAEIKMASASGFNPAKPKEVTKVVANAPSEAVESQPIEQF